MLTYLNLFCIFQKLRSKNIFVIKSERAPFHKLFFVFSYLNNLKCSTSPGSRWWRATEHVTAASSPLWVLGWVVWSPPPVELWSVSTSLTWDWRPWPGSRMRTVESWLRSVMMTLRADKLWQQASATTLSRSGLEQSRGGNMEENFLTQSYSYYLLNNKNSVEWIILKHGCSSWIETFSLVHLLINSKWRVGWMNYLT